MANVKISQLPEYTGNTSGSWLIMNNSGETTTYKVKKENFIPDGADLFQETGSYWNTTNNLGITGSLNVSGSFGVTISGNLTMWNATPDLSNRSIQFLDSSGSIKGNIVYTSNGNSFSIAPQTGVRLSLGGFSSQVDISASSSIINSPLKINGSLNNVGNALITGSLTITGSQIITGSLSGNVTALTISSNTASLDLNNGNFYTLQLVSGSATHINPSNIKAGQTVNIRINTTGSATVTFPSSVKQVSGSSYVPTTTTSVDVVTLVSFDNSSLYLANVKNLI